MDLTSFFSYGDFRSLLRCFLSSCFSANISAMKSLSWILCLKYTHNSFRFPLHKVIVWRHFGYHAHLVLCFGIISSGLCAGMYCFCDAACSGATWVNGTDKISEQKLSKNIISFPFSFFVFSLFLFLLFFCVTSIQKQERL